jgi:hypothetical protein
MVKVDHLELFPSGPTRSDDGKSPATHALVALENVYEVYRILRPECQVLTIDTEIPGRPKVERSVCLGSSAYHPFTFTWTTQTIHLLSSEPVKQIVRGAREGRGARRHARGGSVGAERVCGSDEDLERLACEGLGLGGRGSGGRSDGDERLDARAGHCWVRRVRG